MFDWLLQKLGLKLFAPGMEPGRITEEDDYCEDVDHDLKRIEMAGDVDGRHYTDAVEQVKELKRQGRNEEAIKLLLRLVDATESEAHEAAKSKLYAGWGVAPWYYEQLAILYRKEKRYADEVEILERYDRQPKAPGTGSIKLTERLIKARKLMN